MIVVYTPAGGEPEHYDASTLRVSEASIVQRTVDMKWQEIREGLGNDDLDAMRGIVWVLKKRSQPSLRLGEFDPGVGEMVCRFDQKEVADYVDNAFKVLEKDDDLDVETVKAVLLDQLAGAAADPEHARALIEARAQAPKETAAEAETSPQETAVASSLSPTSNEPDTSTSDSSPTSSTSPQDPSTS